MVADHANYLTFEDPGAVNTVRRALKLAQAGDLLGAAETAGVDVPHAAVVSEGLRRGMRFAIGAEIDNDPRARPDAQNIVDAMRPDGIIRSVHFVSIAHPEKGADWLWPFDSEEFCCTPRGRRRRTDSGSFTSPSSSTISRSCRRTSSATFTSPPRSGSWPTQKQLEEYEDRMLEICTPRGLAVEINTRFLYRDHPEEQKKKYLEANSRLDSQSQGARRRHRRRFRRPQSEGSGQRVRRRFSSCSTTRRSTSWSSPSAAGWLASRCARRASTSRRRQKHAVCRPRRAAASAAIAAPSSGFPKRPKPAHGARAGRETGPKKRASRLPPTKKPRQPPSPPSTSRRSAESSAQAGKAKAARAPNRRPPPPKRRRKARPKRRRKKRPPPGPGKGKKPPKPAPARAAANEELPRQSTQEAAKKGPTRKRHDRAKKPRQRPRAKKPAFAARSSSRNGRRPVTQRRRLRRRNPRLNAASIHVDRGLEQWRILCA